ncbi:hypothetical protein SAMN05660653_02575 [Desulfonatronum thiosulfatophilum]|uniref:Uncharacterized protein n=1 Tax=Desulfonatronum thiosulfatophilum TaxID=617002 RepID=A0A1G6E386_9BACT|nr:hypothetical protein [Desulfonatronum thiosulfatophilum]SDB51841.1 hypothetical protein SAMN05660653_02575 [Desulfonatronum thiosulfatophilum]
MRCRLHHPDMTRWVAVLLVLALLCMGMGGFGDTEAVTKIPRPERSFLVELVDADDVSFRLHDFSMDGLTLIPVTAGRAQISLDFAEIVDVRMYVQDDQVMARVSFRNESTSEFMMQPDLVFYGLTDWGKMKIEAGDVRRITFLGRAEAPQPVRPEAN